MCLLQHFSLLSQFIEYDLTLFEMIGVQPAVKDCVVLYAIFASIIWVATTKLFAFLFCFFYKPFLFQRFSRCIFYISSCLLLVAHGFLPLLYFEATAK